MIIRKILKVAGIVGLFLTTVFLSFFSYYVFTLDPSFAVVYATDKNNRISNIFMFRLKVINSCKNWDLDDISPIHFVLNGYNYKGSGNNKIILEVSDTFLNQGCDINSYDSLGITPLHASILSLEPDVVKYLLKNGADPLKKAIEGRDFQGNPEKRYIGMNSFEFAKYRKSWIKEEQKDYIQSLKKIGQIIEVLNINNTKPNTGLNDAGVSTPAQTANRVARSSLSRLAAG
jgi:ankyrin repeat protein